VQKKNVNGIDLAYDIQGSGPDFVLVHGFTGSSLDWADVIEPLSERHRVVTLDHRGHGESTNTGDLASYSFDQLVSDLDALLDALGLQQFDLLGHSMGGIVAMRYVLGPGRARVRSLILMDTLAEPPAGMGDFMRAGVGIVREQGTGALYDMSAAMLGNDAHGDVLRARLRTKLDQMDPVAFAALGTELTEFPSLLDRLPTIDVPTTVIVGEHDTGLRPAADDIAAAVPNAKQLVIPNAAHSPQDENRAAWLDAMNEHFNR
jgi:pimeloyl-ACP methyl ester carboxylesterase